ncbi:hypothetical protein BGI51_08180 [Pseudomonas oryzihabitans]|nr:hypothetical protein BGI51_08180 [Pseudomonas psychrotolerans]
MEKRRPMGQALDLPAQRQVSAHCGSRRRAEIVEMIAQVGSQIAEGAGALLGTLPGIIENQAQGIMPMPGQIGLNHQRTHGRPPAIYCR